MPVTPDFRDLFAALNAAEARYLLVGGYAVAFHAQPRFTKDLDVGRTRSRRMRPACTRRFANSALRSKSSRHRISNEWGRSSRSACPRTGSTS